MADQTSTGQTQDRGSQVSRAFLPVLSRPATINPTATAYHHHTHQAKGDIIPLPGHLLLNLGLHPAQDFLISRLVSGFISPRKTHLGDPTLGV